MLWITSMRCTGESDVARRPEPRVDDRPRPVGMMSSGVENEKRYVCFEAYEQLQARQDSKRRC
jgi:hypothetical protein